MKLKYIFAIVLTLYFLFMPSLVNAKTYKIPYSACVLTVIPNSTFEQPGYVVADLNEGIPPLFDPPGATITRAAVGWKVQPGDRLEIKWYNWQEKKTGTTKINISDDPPTLLVNPPAGSYAGKLLIITGDSRGGRYFYWIRVRNSVNNDIVFPIIGL